jgi:mono/diheme cytochrome c family protein
MFMDTVVSFAMFAIIVALAVFSPAPLDAKADPNNTQFVPYPAWYFMALFSLLDVVGGAPSWAVNFLSLFATIIFPTLLIVLLIALPFIDRSPSRRLERRPWVVGSTAVVLGGAIILSFVGQYHVEEQQALHGLTGASVAEASTTGGGDIAVDHSTGSAGGSATSGGAAAGAAVFTANCSGCHGANGQGQAGVFPPLAGNPVVVGDKTKVITILNNGLNGSIQVNGATYNGQMPAWKGNLTPAQIADVITYIRSAWGNKGDAVTAAEVSAVK